MTSTDFFAWVVPWEPSLTVIFFLLSAALLYGLGATQIHPSGARRISYWAGLATLAIACQSGLDYYAEHEFFIHRIQHIMLHHVGPFLITIARPGEMLARGTPLHFRKKYMALINWKPLAFLIDILNNPFIASTFFCSMIALWLVPPIHFIAMLDVRLYRAMNWGMAINGLMFWNLALNNFALRPAKLSALSRALMMLAIIPPQIALGVMLFASTRELYPIYSLCGRVMSLSPIADQQLGGLLLWISAAMMSVFGVLVVFRAHLVHAARS